MVDLNEIVSIVLSLLYVALLLASIYYLWATAQMYLSYSNILNEASKYWESLAEAAQKGVFVTNTPQLPSLPPVTVLPVSPTVAQSITST